HRISAYLFEAAAEARLPQALTALKDSRTLSRRAVRTYLSIPGVSAVLVGMRNARYVEDLLLDAPSELQPYSADEAQGLLVSFMRRADRILEAEESPESE